MILYAISVIGLSLVVGFIAGRLTKHADLEAENEFLASVNLHLTWDITELQEEVQRLKRRRCVCADHLDDLRRTGL